MAYTTTAKGCTAGRRKPTAEADTVPEMAVFDPDETVANVPSENASPRAAVGRPPRKASFVPKEEQPGSAEDGSDARLIEAVRSGDVDAYGAVVRRYESRLSRVIGRFVQDADLIDDLTQDTFIRTYERLDQFDASRRFGPWLFRVGVNLTLDHLRKKKRRRWVSLFSEGPCPTDDGRSYDPGSADPRTTIDMQQEVRAVLEGVAEKYRTVLVLRDLENFSTSEIAAILDRKEATIRWRLAEARSQFETLWSKRQQAIG